MRKTIIGNWKMHGAPSMAHALSRAVADCHASLPVKPCVVLCPPSIWLERVSQALNGAPIYTGGQDCHEEREGAYTGDTSAAMLKEAGGSYVLLGHSERRSLHQETSGLVRRKAERAMEAGLLPVVCIGESLSQREAGEAEAAVEEQVKASLPDMARNGKFLLAYEPVWAIGSGKIPSLEDIRRMHAHIQKAAAHLHLAADAVHVLYGGSVKPDNARGIMAVEGVSGVLVGGASLKADEFCRIIEAGA